MSIANPTANLLLERQVDGTNNNAWNDRYNANFARLDQAITGSVSIDVTAGDVTLTAVDSADLNADDQTRYAIIKVIGTPGVVRNVIWPTGFPVSKLYVLGNATAYAVTFKVTGQTGITVSPGTSILALCTGTDIASAHPTPVTTDSSQAVATTAYVNAATSAALSTVNGIVRSLRTSNTALAFSDRTTLVDMSGTYTQTFGAAASMINGWYVRLRNNGTGDITLTFNASETCDGLTTFVMYPGEVRLIQCDSVGFNSIVMVPFYRVFIASAANGFVKPPGYAMFEGLIWGGGGSGGWGGLNVAYSGAGGGGGCTPFTIYPASMTATVSVVIASGGASVTAQGNGNPGGNSSLGSYAAGYGGGYGTQNTGPNSTDMGFGGGGGGTLSAGLSGSSALGGQPFVLGYSNNTMSAGQAFGGGMGGNINGSYSSGYGGSSQYGGGGGGVASYGGSSQYGGGGGNGGTSVVGGNGGINTSSSATAGSAPGGGGAAYTGNTAAYPSGAGARGEMRIWGLV